MILTPASSNSSRVIPRFYSFTPRVLFGDEVSTTSIVFARLSTEHSSTISYPSRRQHLGHFYSLGGLAFRRGETRCHRDKIERNLFRKITATYASLSVGDVPGKISQMQQGFEEERVIDQKEQVCDHFFFLPRKKFA